MDNKMKYLLILFFTLLEFSFAQANTLSTNPWEQENTKEQIDSVYKKRQRRIYKTNHTQNIDTSTSYQTPSPKENSIIDKISSLFDNDEPIHETSQPTINTKRNTKPQKISSPQKNNIPTTPSNPNQEPQPSSNDSIFSMPKLDTSSIPDLPTLPSSESLIKKFERAIGIDLKKIGKQLK